MSGNESGGATTRRNRTHSLSEDVHVAELKNAGPAAKKLPFTAASKLFRHPRFFAGADGSSTPR